MKKEDITDKELLQACIDGQEWGWEIFYEKYVRLIHYYIMQTAKVHNYNLSQEDLEDCYQSILLAILKDDCRRLRSFRGEHGCTLASWLRIITIRLTHNYLQSISRVNAHNISSEELTTFDKISSERTPDSEEKFLEKEMWDNIYDVIENKLTPREKLIANLYWIDGLSFEEIADITKLSVNNLYLIRHRIQKKIKKIIERK
ncbi:MAG: RNA polymerase sigma factor [bacterium]